MAEIAAQVQRVYDDGDYVGSLVVDGPAGRATEYDGPKDEPPGRRGDFCQRCENCQHPTSRLAGDRRRDRPGGG